MKEKHHPTSAAVGGPGGARSALFPLHPGHRQKNRSREGGAASSPRGRWRASRMSGKAKARVIVAAVFVPILLLTVVGLHLISREAGQAVGVGGFTLSLGADAAYPQGLLPAGLEFDRLLLEKKARRLTAYFEGKPARVYLVALGFAPEGHKEVEGDGKTPEGQYYIDSKNPRSAYYKNLGISYPNEVDREHAAELGQSPGGDIKIHGLAPMYAALGQAHRLTDWTYGCIAVDNEAMEELYQRTPVGTPILIVP